MSDRSGNRGNGSNGGGNAGNGDGGKRSLPQVSGPDPVANLPAIGPQAEKVMEGFKAGVREVLQPPAFFESLGVRYVGPVNGHDLKHLIAILGDLKRQKGFRLPHRSTRPGRSPPKPPSSMPRFPS